MAVSSLSCYSGQKYKPIQEGFGEVQRIASWLGPQEPSILIASL